MNRTLKLFLITAAAVLVVAAISIAAQPTPGAVYKGETGEGTKVRLKVNDAGTKLKFTVNCGVDKSTAKGVKIEDDGSFRVEKAYWGAAGKFKRQGKKAAGTIGGVFCFLGQDNWVARRQD